MKKLTMAMVVLVATVAGSMVAMAGGPGEGRRGGNGPCKADVERLCGDVEGRKAAFECLKANEDQLSDACVERMEKKRAKHEERRAVFQTACGADAEAMCSGLERKELRMCMKDNFDDLSAQCSEAIKSAKGQRKR